MGKRRANVRSRKKQYENLPRYVPVAKGVSPSEFELRTCLGKMAWDSRRKAESFPLTRGMSAYRCPMCELWHLTTAAQ